MHIVTVFPMYCRYFPILPTVEMIEVKKYIQ